jgi:hypothetical protein
LSAGPATVGTQAAPIDLAADDDLLAELQLGLPGGVSSPTESVTTNKSTIVAEAHNGLNRCISAKTKVLPESARKNIHFGSVDVREFDRHAPTMEQKPVSRNEANSMRYIYRYMSCLT